MKNRTLITALATLAVGGFASAATVSLSLDNGATNQIELRNGSAGGAPNSGSVLLDTQTVGPSGSRNLYFDNDNSGVIEAGSAEEIGGGGGGNLAPAFTYTLGPTSAATPIVWQWIGDGDGDGLIAAIEAGTGTGSLNDFTLNVNGSDLTISGLATDNPLLGVGGVGTDVDIALTVLDGGTTSVDNISYADGQGDTIVRLTITDSVPEPGSLALLGLGGLLIARRRRA